MTTPTEKLKIASQIVDWEARRDSQGNIKIYTLPPGDGGGSYEVAGINNKYHPEKAKQLKELVEQGRYAEVETIAANYIVIYTDRVTPWTNVTGVEAYLRDSSFNRGPKGAARIYQIALGVSVDGIVGPVTLAAANQAELQPIKLIKDLRQARERYEREWVGRDESSSFWTGLVNRWNKSLDFSLSFIQ